MFIKHLDFISPPISFYHKGHLSHFSIVSGIITIISVIIIISLAIYFSLDLIKRRNPVAFYYNSFVKDAGEFPLNASSFFHFISLSVNNNNVDNGVDFKTFRVIGFNDFFTNYLEDRNLSKYEHWLYGLCNNKTDTEGISNLIEYDFFEKSACIKKYFNPQDKKYYNIGEGKFKWPILAHGTFNPETKFYGMIIERCQEETINLVLGEGNHCISDEELSNLFTGVGAVHLYYIDHYIDVLNYKNPTRKFLYNIENGIYLGEYTENNININPTSVRTHNGLILDNIEEEFSYSFERNDAYTYASGNHEIFTTYYIWLKNRINYYERNYKRIQDVFSSIGGIYQITFVIAVLINRLYNNYIVLCDTESLLFSSIYTEKNTYFKKKTIINSVIEENIEQEKQNNSNSDKTKDIKKESIEQETNKTEKKSFNEAKINFEEEVNVMEQNKTQIRFSHSSKDSNSLSNNVGDKNEKSHFTEEVNKINSANNNNFEDNKTTDNFLASSNAPSIRYMPTIRNIPTIPKEKKKRRKFWNYILYFISCEKKNNFFKVYKDFRIKIFSEEHLIRNHLNIYNLLRVSDKKINFRRHSYQLRDLIKLV